MTDPALVVADEPTGDLDSRKSQEILDLLQELQIRLQKTILLVTHDLAVAVRVRRLLRIQDGQLIDDTENPDSVSHPLLEASMFQVRHADWRKRIARSQKRSPALSPFWQVAISEAECVCLKTTVDERSEFSATLVVHYSQREMASNCMAPSDPVDEIRTASPFGLLGVKEPGE